MSPTSRSQENFTKNNHNKNKEKKKAPIQKSTKISKNTQKYPTLKTKQKNPTKTQTKPRKKKESEKTWREDVSQTFVLQAVNLSFPRLLSDSGSTCLHLSLASQTGLKGWHLVLRISACACLRAHVHIYRCICGRQILGRRFLPGC